MLITIDGSEGTDKFLITKLLKDYLVSLGHKVMLYKELGVNKLIKPELEAGKIIILNRFLYSAKNEDVKSNLTLFLDMIPKEDIKSSNDNYIKISALQEPEKVLKDVIDTVKSIILN